MSSTTGNIYGIYDMVGGLWEYTMGFGKDENNILFGSTGFTNETIPDKKYYQTYSTNACIYLGDGLYETAWGNYKDFPFVVLWRGTQIGELYTIFDFRGYNGSANYMVGFRTCLAVK